jgi:cytochrome c oxidase subunit 2
VESFDPVTRQGLDISNLFGLELAISAALLALVLGWLIVALVRFRARADDPTEPPQTHGNRRLEIAWTALPALVLAVVFVLVVQTMRSVDAAEPDSIRLRVIGHQWWWEFQYVDLGVVTANEVVVPIGVPLSIDLESTDVIHSFYVPRFGWMRDAVPGTTNRIHVRVERGGTFEGACTQFCGMQHAWMRSRVAAVPRAEFDAWVAGQHASASLASTSPTAARGQQVFLENTCVSCHVIRGLPAQPQVSSGVGPDLTHMASRSTLGAGVIDNTPENLRLWLRDAQRVKPGVLMPPFRSMSEEDLRALAEFLGTLE